MTEAREKRRKAQYEEYKHFREAEEMLTELRSKELPGVPVGIEFSEHFTGSMDNTAVWIKFLDRDENVLWDVMEAFYWEVQYDDCEELYYFLEELIRMYPIEYLKGGTFSGVKEDFQDFIEPFDWDEKNERLLVKR